MGFPNHARRQLASADLVVAHAGCEMVWVRAGWPPSHQHFASRRQHAGFVLPDEALDHSCLARRHGSGPVRFSSLARRIRRLDFRTKRCAQHSFWLAQSLGLRPLRAERQRTAAVRNRSNRKIFRSRCKHFTFHASRITPHTPPILLLRSLADTVRLFAHVQSHARYVAIPPVAFGLLAARASCP